MPHLHRRSARITVPNAQLWSPKSPVLHTIEITSKTETALDSIVERFGLRKVEVSQGKILLNGEALSLRGFCRHESHPN
ncbi:MAG: hypothetical protein GW949_00250 [Spirochaetales bacterium]|nr:hypothetical protein [Spirochaetales bacterium]